MEFRRSPLQPPTLPTRKSVALNSERPETARSAVPDLSRMSLKQATETLQQKGLTVGVVTKVDSIEAMTGKVVEQRPSGHTQVSAETPTDIAIGRGVNTTFVPNVVGMTAGPAKQMINNAYLVYTEQRGPSADPDKGKIVAQDPEPGKPTTPNSTVTVGTGLTMVTVPKGIVGKAARTSAKTHPEELPPPVDLVGSMLIELPVQRRFQRDGVVAEDKRVLVELERHRRAAELVGPLHRVLPTGHADPDDAITEAPTLEMT